MNPDDRELRKRLRQVDVPGDLKNRLRKIADQPPHEIEPLENSDLGKHDRSTRSTSWTLVVLALAASLTGIGLYLFWPQPPETIDSIALDQPTSQSNPGEASENHPTAEPQTRNPLPESTALANQPSSQFLLDEMAAQARQLDQLVLQLQVNRLSDQVRRMENRTPRRSANALAISDTDHASMVLTYSNQSALQLGADPKIVKQNFAAVIADFPNSPGSRLAQQALNNEL